MHIRQVSHNAAVSGFITCLAVDKKHPCTLFLVSLLTLYNIIFHKGAAS